MRTGSQIKRVHPRHVTSGRFRGSQLPSHPSRRKSQIIEGKVRDISDGGFCLVAAQPPERTGLLQGRLLFPHLPTQIPTLVQVRWVERVPSGRNYRIGLQYVI